MPIIGKDSDIVIMDDPHAVGDMVPRETVIGWFKGEVPEPIPTPTFPFGLDVDTLILCRDEAQRSAAIRALQIKARYEIWSAALMGNRFSKIIWLAGFSESPVEQVTQEAMIKEYFPTKLRPGGSLIVL